MDSKVKDGWTPGPWCILGGYDTMFLVGRESNGEAVCDVCCDHHPDTSSVDPSDLDVANAHLIAAAPELYEAAEIGVKWMIWWLLNSECECEYGHSCGYNERQREIEQIQQALKKARGEQPCQQQ